MRLVHIRVIGLYVKYFFKNELVLVLCFFVLFTIRASMFYQVYQREARANGCMSDATPTRVIVKYM